MDLVGGPAAADAVAVAAGQQTGGDGDRSDGHGRGHPEEPRPHGYAGSLPPAGTAGPVLRVRRVLLSGGGRACASMPSHALCLPRASGRRDDVTAFKIKLTRSGDAIARGPYAMADWGGVLLDQLAG